jgi:Ala-tRNA(Pro) deacylase
MPATPEDLFAFLDRLGIVHTTVSHPALFTVEQSRALRGKIPGGHTKNLFLRDKKGAFYLVVAQEEAAIALKDLHRRLGASGRFSFGSTEAMGELLGVVPGSVTPFAAINDTSGEVTVVLDHAMLINDVLNNDVLNFHPLVNTMTTSISKAGLIEFLAATGHEPRIEAVSGEAAGTEPWAD